MGLGQTTNIGNFLSALDLSDVADRKKNRRLGQAVHHHVQEPGEICEGAAHAEGKRDDTHMLN